VSSSVNFTAIKCFSHPKNPAIGQILTAHCSAANFGQLPLSFSLNVFFLFFFVCVCFWLRGGFFCAYSLWRAAYHLKGQFTQKGKFCHLHDILVEPECLSYFCGSNVEEYACCFSPQEFSSHIV